MANKNKAKIVRIGWIKEWYAPTYNPPVMENDGIYALFDKLGIPYVYGVEVRKDERICDDLGCICDRMECDGWDGTVIANAVEDALEDNIPRYVTNGERMFKIEPFAEVPTIPDSAYSEFGEYAEIFKERMAAI